MKRDFPRIDNLADFPGELRGGVVAIGNFDGVHRGHQAVLDRACSVAKSQSVPALVLTFEPHPRTVFRPDHPVYRITPAAMKAVILAAEGFDAVVEQRFDREFAASSAEEFVRSVLVNGLGISHVVTGFDFHFGKNRQGGPAYLMEAGERLGFEVSLIDAFRDEGAEVVSSSRIREMLGAGDVAGAAGLLGYRYTVASPVARGKQLGRTLGYPTANMILPSDTGLRHGVYAVRFRRANGEMFDGVASFGLRPTVDTDGEPMLETFLFDFNGDLYDESCRVSIFGLLRPEEKFDDLEQLTEQMDRDAHEARALLSGVQPLSELDRKIAFS
jgi:riboflavin kinase/FMN adenylyltransferase